MWKSLPCPMPKDTGNSGVCGQVTALAHRGHAHPGRWACVGGSSRYIWGKGAGLWAGLESQGAGVRSGGGTQTPPLQESTVRAELWGRLRGPECLHCPTDHTRTAIPQAPAPWLCTPPMHPCGHQGRTQPTAAHCGVEASTCLTTCVSISLPESQFKTGFV